MDNRNNPAQNLDCIKKRAILQMILSLVAETHRHSKMLDLNPLLYWSAYRDVYLPGW